MPINIPRNLLRRFPVLHGLTHTATCCRRIRVPWADAHGYLLSPPSRLSGRLAHAAFLQMSYGLALEFGLPGFTAAAFAALLPYATFPDGSPRALARGNIPNRKARSPLQRCGSGESCEAAPSCSPGRQPGVVGIPRQPSRECGGIESSRIVHLRPALFITVCIFSMLPVVSSDSTRSHHPL